MVIGQSRRGNGQLGKIVELLNQSQPDQGPRANGTSCTHISMHALFESPETRAAESGDTLDRHDGALDEHEEHLLQGQRQALLVLAGRHVHLGEHTNMKSIVCGGGREIPKKQTKVREVA